ncbi:MAG: dihydrofolate reductase family protein [Gemmatimonadaceae bacterium]
MKASVFIATSLDGFIARQDGDLDWLPGGDVEDHGYDAFMSTVDTIVMGRGTYEKVLTFGDWAFGETLVVVLTSQPETLPTPPAPTVLVMSGTPEEVVAALQARGAKSLYIDGGVTIQRFLAAGLIQRLVITRVPVLLGAGRPLFGELAQDVRLRHVSSRAYDSGLVQSEYEVLA